MSEYIMQQQYNVNKSTSTNKQPSKGNQHGRQQDQRNPANKKNNANNNVNKFNGAKLPLSLNMHYAFYKEYFDSICSIGQNKFSLKEELDLIHAKFPINLVKNKNISFANSHCLKKFQLESMYPGVLIGMGYAHCLSSKNAVKCGFSFDYVTGLPYIPGSSIKGMLRSYFPYAGTRNKLSVRSNTDQQKELMIQKLLGVSVDVKQFCTSIFDGINVNGNNVPLHQRDIFLDAYPSCDNPTKILIAYEYITPHPKEGQNKKLNPIKLIKVKPGIKFEFSFILHDYTDSNGNTISADQKCDLFKEIIKLMGVGAKTNVGFGKMREA